MKKIFNIIGICALTCFSFYYTDKMVLISRQNDPIMQEINNIKDKHTIKAVNAEIKDDYIKSGKSGELINIDESYAKMKKLGSFNENLLVFMPDFPTINLENNYDKFVIGSNSNKQEISLIFTVDCNKNLNKVLHILRINETTATFFVDGKWAEENNNYLTAIASNHYIANLGYNKKYTIASLKYTNAILKLETNYDIKYCYTEEDNYDTLKLCANEKMHTIKPIKTKDNLVYSTIKNTLKKGEIYSIPISNTSLSEIDIAIKYIKQKGYKIVPINKLLNEKNA